jgi:hypoxia induced protein
MQFVFFHLSTIAVFVVIAVLLAGLVTMMRGKSPNLSQKLMRWRVGLQFVAIIIIMTFIYLQQHAQ